MLCSAVHGRVWASKNAAAIDKDPAGGLRAVTQPVYYTACGPSTGLAISPRSQDVRRWFSGLLAYGLCSVLFAVPCGTVPPTGERVQHLDLDI